MSLYIRLHTNFWTHRKTMRLKTLIGNDAFWIPQRLWSYAAENQPDGDFSAYQAEELCLLIGCLSNASSMLQALQQAGFMDGMKVHDWGEHNEYHHTFSERAKKAAKARWDKEENTKPETRKERKGKEQALLEHAPSINEPKNEPFESFWMVYPKKKAKGKARVAFDKALKMVSLEEILLAVGRLVMSPDWIKEGGKWIPYPASWLNSEGWHDQTEMPSLSFKLPLATSMTPEQREAEFLRKKNL